MIAQFGQAWGATTLAMAFFDEKSVVLGHIGDSRIYRLRDDQLTFRRYHAAGDDGHLRMLAAALRSGMLGEEDVSNRSPAAGKWIRHA